MAIELGDGDALGDDGDFPGSGVGSYFGSSCAGALPSGTVAAPVNQGLTSGALLVVKPRALCGFLRCDYMNVMVYKDRERLVRSDRHVVAAHEVVRKEAQWTK
jgi:hypothetical protein